MQRMHQSYKYMKAQEKKLVGVHPTHLLTKTEGILRKPIIGIYKPSSIMKYSHQYMKVTTQETLYHEDHGATLEHNYGNRIVALSLLSFSLIFFILGILFFGLFSSLFFIRSLISTCGVIMVSIILSSLGQCSNNDDHHTFIFLTTQQLQLDTQNKV